LPIPQVAAVGAQANTANAGGSGALSVPLPAGVVAGQILILVVEAANEPINAIAGWTNVGTGTVVQANGVITDLTIRWMRATGSDTAPSVQATPQNHLVARIMSVYGCVTTGSPISGTPAVLADNGTTAAFSIPGGTTANADCLVVAALSTGTDVTSTAMASGWTSTTTFADPSLTEQMDNWHVTGNGGGFALAVGGKATAGAYNAITGTLTTGNTKACMSFGLIGAAAAPPGQAKRQILTHSPSYYGYSSY
jgi:hypothetical protein